MGTSEWPQVMKIRITSDPITAEGPTNFIMKSHNNRRCRPRRRCPENSVVEVPVVIRVTMITLYIIPNGAVRIQPVLSESGFHLHHHVLIVVNQTAYFLPIELPIVPVGILSTRSKRCMPQCNRGLFYKIHLDHPVR